MKHKIEYKDGYKLKQKDNGRLAHKLPFFCPNESCRRITSTLDDPYMLEYGICYNCYVLLVEGRQKPLIDVSVYQKRLKERGY